MNDIKKLAAKDAARWASAKMFFGEGAGTRRKLLSAEIATKTENISGYHAAFEKALGQQDMGKHAVRAAKERARIDTGRAVRRNVRGLVTGNRNSLTTGVAVVFTAAAFAHQTGLDAAIAHEAKIRYQKGKTWVENRKAVREVKRDLRLV